MKGILVSYAFSPKKTVGALRPSYWAEEINQISNIELDVITATESKKPNVFVVPNTSKSIFSFLIKDEGLRWRKDVKKFIVNFPIENYSFVILTGGPFFHFYSLAKFFKKHGLKVILDFRDPFSYNPRFNAGIVNKYIKQKYEDFAVKYADLIITVNKECHQYIAPNSDCKRAIIPNGFDERKLPKTIKPNFKSKTLFYAGKFYWKPELFFQVLEDNNWKLIHAGHPCAFDTPFLHSNNYQFIGMLSQEELYKTLQKSELGVVFTMNIPFESTTKIYDYIGLNQKILIVTQGSPEKGALLREMKTYPNYRWTSNQKNEIKTAIEELFEMKSSNFDSTKYSRKQSLNRLISEIKALCQ